MVHESVHSSIIYCPHTISTLEREDRRRSIVVRAVETTVEVAGEFVGTLELTFERAKHILSTSAEISSSGELHIKIMLRVSDVIAMVLSSVRIIRMFLRIGV